MTTLRFFIDVERFVEGDIVCLEDKEFHHARDVVRIEKGESIPLINGKGSSALGRVEAIERHRCLILILNVTQEKKPTPRLYLGLSLLRPGHLDFAIEKGTEVGVDHFVLFPSDKSEKKELFPSMIRRLDALITAATKQSGRTFRPEISHASSLKEALLLLPTPHLWADLHEEALPLKEKLEILSPTIPLSILIGPESGWSDDEKRLLLHEGPPVLLHHNVLRAETAAVVAAYTISQR